jgi:hypothetical protein
MSVQHCAEIAELRGVETTRETSRIPPKVLCVRDFPTGITATPSFHRCTGTIFAPSLCGGTVFSSVAKCLETCNLCRNVPVFLVIKL